jgi:hypothetical protein
MALRLAVLFIALHGVAQAESLPDPTRPATGWNAATPTEALPSGPQLQAIRTQNGIRSALVSGQTVRIGSQVEGALVTRIDEDRVWLRGPNGVQQLKLFPEVEKQHSANASAPHIKTPAKPGPHPTKRRGLRKETE